MGESPSGSQQMGGGGDWGRWKYMSVGWCVCVCVCVVGVGGRGQVGVGVGGGSFMLLSFKSG